MPRTTRASVGDICYHVINGGMHRLRYSIQIEVFHKDGDYRAFVELMGLACQRIPMANHFHLTLWARSDRRPRPLDAMAFDGPRAALSIEM